MSHTVQATQRTRTFIGVIFILISVGIVKFEALGITNFIDLERLFGALTAEAASRPGAAAESVWPSFRYTFSHDGKLIETNEIDESRSRYWWLSSGAELIIDDGLGKTLHGVQPDGSSAQVRYEKYSNESSDGGKYPQNIFRLVTREDRWQNYKQEVDFKIDQINTTDARDRDASDGVLLFNRYQDQNTLYYAGVRVDGTVVIKKKYRGSYSTLAQKSFFNTSTNKYDEDTNPNLISENQWMAMRTTVRNVSGGAVEIKLYIDPENDGTWKLATEAIDRGQDGNPPITAAGHGGIRTDFMDASFDNYYIVE